MTALVHSTEEIHTVTRRHIRVTSEELERTFAPDWGLHLWEIARQPDGTYILTFGREDWSKR